MILSDWEAWLVTANMRDWMDLNPCECEGGLCECDEGLEGAENGR